LIIGFLNAAVGIVNANLIPWIKSLPGKIFGWIGETVGTLVIRGKNLIIGFINAAVGIVNESLIPWIKSLPGKIFSWIGDTVGTLALRGRNLMVGFINGAINYVNSDLIPWIQSIGDKIFNWIGDMGSVLYGKGQRVITGFLDGMKSVWDNVTGWIGDRANDIGGVFSDFLGIGGPSKVFCEIGKDTILGFHNGLKDSWRNTETWLNELDPSKPILQGPLGKMQDALGRVSDELGMMDEFNPTITPVLDLTMVQEQAKRLAGMLPASNSYAQASRIASTALLDREDSTTSTDGGLTEIKFEQNNYSPQALSTAEIYRQTRSQIAMAKEELAIP
jgi:hypothetical protein